MFELTQAQKDLKQRAAELAQRAIAPRAAAVDESEEYPWDNVRDLTEAGFMGMTVPRDYGGQGLGFLEAVLVFESERLTGALLDRLTHHVNNLEMNGDSYRLNQSRRRQTPTAN